MTDFIGAYLFSALSSCKVLIGVLGDFTCNGEPSVLRVVPDRYLRCSVYNQVA